MPSPTYSECPATILYLFLVAAYARRHVCCSTEATVSPMLYLVSRQIFFLNKGFSEKVSVFFIEALQISILAITVYNSKSREHRLFWLGSLVQTGKEPNFYCSHLPSLYPAGIRPGLFINTTTSHSSHLLTTSLLFI